MSACICRTATSPGIGQHVPTDERHVLDVTMTDPATARIQRKPVVNGLINEYMHAA
jgi:hypothetical protein